MAKELREIETQEVEVLEAKLVCPRCGSSLTVTPLPKEQGHLPLEVWKPRQGGVVGVADCSCSEARPFLVALPPTVIGNISSIILACHYRESEVGIPWTVGVGRWLFGPRDPNK